VVAVRPANMERDTFHVGAYRHDVQRIRAFAAAHPDIPPTQIVEELHLTMSPEMARQIVLDRSYPDPDYRVPMFTWRRSPEARLAKFVRQPRRGGDLPPIPARDSGRPPASKFPFRCALCGMGYDTDEEARACCAALLRRRRA